MKPLTENAQQKFRFTHLFRYKGNRVQDFKTELVASGQVVNSNIHWTVLWSTSL